MAKSTTSNPIKLKHVRLSFPSLDEARRYQDSNTSEIPKYKCTLILDPSNPVHERHIKEINDSIAGIIKKQWTKTPPKMKPIECFGKGDNCVSEESGKVYDGYEGMYYVSGNGGVERGNGKRILTLVSEGGSLVKVTDPDEINRIFYAGCYVDASIVFWTQDNDWGKAIRCVVRGVKFVEDGPAFSSGGVDIEKEFDEDEIEDDNDFIGSL